jgi:hypothetical protein
MAGDRQSLVSRNPTLLPDPKSKRAPMKTVDERLAAIEKQLALIDSKHDATMDFLNKNFTVASRILRENDIKRQAQEEKNRVFGEISGLLRQEQN